MGLPELSFAYSTAAQTVVRRSKRGIVALILQDTAPASGVYTVVHEADIPAELGADNQEAVRRALKGYLTAPSKVYLAVIGAAAQPVTGLDLLVGLDYDYIAGPPTLAPDAATALATKVKELRKGNYIGKAVLPGQAADDVGVINLVAEEIVTGGKKLTAAAYCGRIAGLLAGTPMEGSATGAALPEVTSVKAMTEKELDAAMDAGKLVLYHDGRKVRLGRAVNSKTSLTEGETKILKKIKAIEAIDLIHHFAVTTADDEYRGQCANTFDNKMVLVAALRDYLLQLEQDEIVEEGSSGAELDLKATRAYLVEQGVDVTAMTDEEILHHNTDSYVFIRLSGRIMDAMEDFKIGLILKNT